MLRCHQNQLSHSTLWHDWVVFGHLWVVPCWTVDVTRFLLMSFAIIICHFRVWMSLAVTQMFEWKLLHHCLSGSYYTTVWVEVITPLFEWKLLHHWLSGSYYTSVWVKSLNRILGGELESTWGQIESKERFNGDKLNQRRDSMGTNWIKGEIQWGQIESKERFNGDKLSQRRDSNGTNWIKGEIQWGQIESKERFNGDKLNQRRDSMGTNWVKGEIHTRVIELRFKEVATTKKLTQFKGIWLKEQTEGLWSSFRLSTKRTQVQILCCGVKTWSKLFHSTQLRVTQLNEWVPCCRQWWIFVRAVFVH